MGKSAACRCKLTLCRYVCASVLRICQSSGSIARCPCASYSNSITCRSMTWESNARAMAIVCGNTHSASAERSRGRRMRLNIWPASFSGGNHRSGRSLGLSRPAKRVRDRVSTLYGDERAPKLCTQRMVFGQVCSQRLYGPLRVLLTIATILGRDALFGDKRSGVRVLRLQLLIIVIKTSRLLALTQLGEEAFDLDRSEFLQWAFHQRRTLLQHRIQRLEGGAGGGAVENANGDAVTPFLRTLPGCGTVAGIVARLRPPACRPVRRSSHKRAVC